jgi:signal transduction histidine kinase
MRVNPSRAPGSIRRQLLLGLSSALVAAGVAVGVFAYLNALQEVDAIFDDQLTQIAFAVHTQGHPNHYEEDHGPHPEFEFVTQVWRPDGTLVFHSRFEDRSLLLPFARRPGFSTLNILGEEWRIFASIGRFGIVQVGQPLEQRRALARSFAGRIVLPYLLLLPLMGALFWWVLRRGLAPLNEATRAVTQKNADALEPLPVDHLPSELRPLLSALNGLMGRLDDSLSAQRRFTADAAHELRSPLTALKLQVQLLERSTDEAGRVQAIENLKGGLERAIHTVQQLLSLARLEPGAKPFAQEPLDLLALARQVAGDYALIAENRGIDLGVEADIAVRLRGDREALRILLSNLVDNALRYTLAPGRVDIRVERLAACARLCVEDNGPGIPESDRERIFDRFYRVPGQGGRGSGLGLSIVKTVAEQHGASLALGNGPDGQGLSVQVIFPSLDT